MSGSPKPLEFKTDVLATHSVARLVQAYAACASRLCCSRSYFFLKARTARNRESGCRNRKAPVPGIALFGGVLPVFQTFQSELDGGITPVKPGQGVSEERNIALRFADLQRLA